MRKTSLPTIREQIVKNPFSEIGDRRVHHDGASRQGPSLSPEQRQALERFASRHGRTWKSKLRSLWTSGKDDRGPDGGLLRQVRNTVGPVGLSGIRLKVSA